MVSILCVDLFRVKSLISEGGMDKLEWGTDMLERARVK